MLSGQRGGNPNAPSVSENSPTLDRILLLLSFEFIAINKCCKITHTQFGTVKLLVFLKLTLFDLKDTSY